MEYKIIIQDTTDDSASPIAGTNADGSAQNKKKEESSVEKGAKGYIAVKKFVAPFVDQVLSYQISTVALRTGNNDRQQRYQYAYNIGKRAYSAVESTVVGGITGGWVGAIIGLVTNLTSTAISVSQQIEKFNLSRNIENNAIGLMNIRAGGGVASNGSR